MPPSISHTIPSSERCDGTGHTYARHSGVPRRNPITGRVADVDGVPRGDAELAAALQQPRPGRFGGGHVVCPMLHGKKRREGVDGEDAFHVGNGRVRESTNLLMMSGAGP